MEFISKRMVYAGSPIREEEDLAKRLAKEGKKVIKLNSGDPPKFLPTPEYILEAYARALKERKTYYADSQGVAELREAVASYYKRHYNVDLDPARIVVTQGVSEAISFVNTALIGRGDRAVLISPYYPSYASYIGLSGGKPMFVPSIEERDWSVDLDALEKTVKKAKRIKYLLVINPNNPTGSVLDRKVLEEIVGIAKDNDLFLVSDEIYDEMVFDGNFTSISQVAKGMPYLLLNGASKTFNVTGIRIGYAALPENDAISNELLNSMVQLARLRISANTPAQYAVAYAMNDVAAYEKAVAQLREEIKSRVLFTAQEVNKSKYLHAVVPRAAFYVFAKLETSLLNVKDDKEFVTKLLEEKQVQITRGSGFGALNHVRLVALADKETMSLAISKIEEFCKEHAR